MRNSFRASAVALAAVTALATQVQAAAVDESELKQMRSEASRRGAVPVMVHLKSVSLDELSKDARTVAIRLRKKEDALLAQLGNHAWQDGRSSNNAGQLSLYVTNEGLEILAASGLAEAFFNGAAWQSRFGFSDGGADGLAEIDRRLDRDGYVDLEVVPRLPNIKYSVNRLNELTVHLAAEDVSVKREIETRARMLSNSSQQLLADDGLVAPQGRDARFALRLDRRGLLRLVSSGMALSLRPAGYADPRPVFVDPEVREDLEKYGQTRVLISIRTPFGGSRMDRMTWASAAVSNRAVLQELLGEIARRDGSIDLSPNGMVGATIRRLNCNGSWTMATSGFFR